MSQNIPLKLTLVDAELGNSININKLISYLVVTKGPSGPKKINGKSQFLLFKLFNLQGFKKEIFIKDASKIIPGLPVKSVKLAINVADGPKHNDGLDDVYDITADYVLELLGQKLCVNGQESIFKNSQNKSNCELKKNPTL